MFLLSICILFWEANNSPLQNYCNIKYSVDNPYSTGCEAVYDTLDKLGFKVSKYRYDSTYLYSVNNKLAISIDDSDFMDSEELDSWIKKGNTAVVITSDGVVNKKLYKFYKKYKKYKFYKLGKGTLVYYDNPNILINKNIKKRAFDFISIIQSIGIKDVTFDEYGKTAVLQQNVWDITPLWLQLIFVQLVIVAIGFVLFYLKPFGKLKNVSEDNKRCVKEYYQAAANLYESAHDYSSMVKEYYANFEHGIIKKYGYSSENSDAQLLEIWRTRGLNNIELLTETIDLIEKIDKTKITEKMFIQLIGKIDMLKKEMHL